VKREKKAGIEKRKETYFTQTEQGGNLRRVELLLWKGTSELEEGGAEKAGTREQLGASNKRDVMDGFRKIGIAREH